MASLFTPGVRTLAACGTSSNRSGTTNLGASRSGLGYSGSCSDRRGATVRYPRCTSRRGATCGAVPGNAPSTRAVGDCPTDRPGGHDQRTFPRRRGRWLRCMREERQGSRSLSAMQEMPHTIWGRRSKACGECTIKGLEPTRTIDARRRHGAGDHGADGQKSVDGVALRPGCVTLRRQTPRAPSGSEPSSRHWHPCVVALHACV
jgi:hypothetical protein